MNLTQIPIPEYDGRAGNFMRGRRGTAVSAIVYHHVAGSLAAADDVFRNPASVRSAHRAIQDAEVHEYVRLTDTAFGAGNWSVNLRCVNKEHADLPGGGFSDLTYETSAQDTYAVALFFGRKVGDLQHLPHSAIVPTACPGGLDIDRIVRRAMEIEAAALPQAVLTSAVKVPVHVEGHVTASQGVKVRTSPTTQSQSVRVMVQGQGFYYLGAGQGESVSGSSAWLLLEDGHYCWAGATDYNQATNA